MVCTKNHQLSNSGKGVNSMNISTHLLDAIRNQFEVFCIRVLQNEARDCYRELERMSKKESLFSELKAQKLNSVSTMQEFDFDCYLFSINGYEIRIKDALIGESISKLPKKKQDIILLSFFLEMTEAEIARQMNLGQSTYHKANSLKELKRIMEEKYSAKCK